MLGVRRARGFVAVALLATGLSTSATVFSAPAAAVSTDEANVARDLLDYANRERAARGLPQLAVDGYTQGKAQEWAETMRNRGSLSHRGDFRTVFAAYPAAGENIGRIDAFAGDMHRTFMGSSEHRRNMLQPGFDAAGVGVACAGDGTMWVTVNFVARSQGVANRYSSSYPSSSPQVVGDAGARCPEPRAASAATVGTPGTGGYWLVARDGGIFAFGDVSFYGSMGGARLNAPIVGITQTKSRRGYWMVARDGGMFSFGDAAFHGSMGGMPLNAPIVGMTSRPTGGGYWMVARDGGLFGFGSAPFRGSMGGQRLNSPIIGMASTATGNGYWMAAADGGIFAFGDARFHGSVGGKPINAPIVAMAATATGNGYWLVARDGGIFAFGDAVFYGSMGGQRLVAPIVSIVRTPKGDGYWLVASDGGVFGFGRAAFRGSTGGVPLNAPIVGAAA